MIKNNKGAILLITIVSMMILTIIGYITLQMVSSQGVMDTYDQTKIRVDYAAEAIVERARGYIDFVVERNMAQFPETAHDPDGNFGDLGVLPFRGQGYLFSAVANTVGGQWSLFNDGSLFSIAYGGGVPEVIDSSMYPHIHASVYCEFLNPPPSTENGIIAHTYNPTETNPRQTYKIVGTAWADVSVANGSRIESTVIYYFETTQFKDAPTAGGNTRLRNDIRMLGWRKQS